MSKSRLVCNLGMADFFTLPDDPDVWRRKGGEPIWIVDWTGNNPKRYKAYECESLYDSSKTVRLKGNDRVDLVDR